MPHRHIQVEYAPPPIPDRRFDWIAVLPEWDFGEPIGHGPTEALARADLLSQLDDEAEDANPGVADALYAVAATLGLLVASAIVGLGLVA